MLRAHVVGHGGGFVSGAGHPVLGPDHLLAMVAVGLLAARLGGRALWSVPAIFVGGMIAGGLLGMNGFPWLPVEAGIALSVVILGAILAVGRRVPLGTALALSLFFAAFHGHAHGTEMPDAARPLLYALGFASGTAALHLFGVFVGVIVLHVPRGAAALRLGGAAFAVAGVTFLMG